MSPGWSVRNGSPGPTPGVVRSRSIADCPPAGVGLGQQALQRHVDPVGIRHVPFAVGKGEPDRLHHEVDGVGRQAAHGAEVEPLHQVERLQQDVAAGIGRHLVDPVAVVVHVDRLVPAGVVGGEVGLVQQAAVDAAGLPYRARNRSLVERGAPLLGDPPQGRAQVLLHQQLTGPQRAPARREHRPGGGVCRQRLVLCLQGRGQLVAHREATLAQLDRGGEHLGQVQLAEAALRQQPAVDQPRHRDAQHAMHGNATVLQVALARRACRRRAGGVDAVRPPRRGVVDQDEAVAADTRHRRLHHAHGRRRGNRRVDRVAAFLHDTHAGLGGERMPRRDHTVEAANRGPMRRILDPVRGRGTHAVAIPRSRARASIVGAYSVT